MTSVFLQLVNKPLKESTKKLSSLLEIDFFNLARIC